MFNIAFNGIITVNRGDSFTIPLMLNAGTTLDPMQYDATETSYLYFAVMEPNQPFETALIKKKYRIYDMERDEDNQLLIKFKPQDTQCVLPGKYYYQVKVQSVNPDNVADYTVDTVFDKTLFYILE